MHCRKQKKINDDNKMTTQKGIMPSGWSRRTQPRLATNPAPTAPSTPIPRPPPYVDIRYARAPVVVPPYGYYPPPPAPVVVAMAPQSTGLVFIKVVGAVVLVVVFFAGLAYIMRKFGADTPPQNTVEPPPLRPLPINNHLDAEYERFLERAGRSMKDLDFATMFMLLPILALGGAIASAPWMGTTDMVVVYRSQNFVIVHDPTAFVFIFGPIATDAAAWTRRSQVWPAVYRIPTDGAVHLHGDHRHAVQQEFATALQSSELHALMRSGADMEGVVLCGYSDGAALAQGIALVLKNPEKLAPVFGVPLAHVDAFREAAGLLPTPANPGGGAVNSFGIGCPPFIRVDAATIRKNNLDVEGIHNILKEGDAVGSVCAYTTAGVHDKPTPEWELLPVGTLAVVTDEVWYGRDADALIQRREASSVRVVMADVLDDESKRRLLGRAAAARASTVVYDASGRVVRPLHGLARYSSMCMGAVQEMPIPDTNRGGSIYAAPNRMNRMPRFLQYHTEKRIATSLQKNVLNSKNSHTVWETKRLC